MTTQVEFNPDFRKIIRESAYVCIEQGREKLAYDMMVQFCPNCRDAFMDYLQSLQGLPSSDFGKPIQLPYMKRQEKPNRGNQNQQQQERGNNRNQPPQREAPQPGNDNKAKPPRPIFENRNREAP